MNFISGSELLLIVMSLLVLLEQIRVPELGELQRKDGTARKHSTLEREIIQPENQFSSVRFRTPVNMGDFGSRWGRMPAAVEKGPVQWAFSQTA